MSKVYSAYLPIIITCMAACYPRGNHSISMLTDNGPHNANIRKVNALTDRQTDRQTDRAGPSWRESGWTFKDMFCVLIIPALQ